MNEHREVFVGIPGDYGLDYSTNPSHLPCQGGTRSVNGFLHVNKRDIVSVILVHLGMSNSKIHTHGNHSHSDSPLVLSRLAISYCIPNRYLSG